MSTPGIFVSPITHDHFLPLFSLFILPHIHICPLQAQAWLLGLKEGPIGLRLAIVWLLTVSLFSVMQLVSALAKFLEPRCSIAVISIGCYLLAVARF